MSTEFSFTSIIKLIRKHFKVLVVVAVIAAGASAFLSGPSFIKPKYKSHFAVFPLNVAPVSIESETEQVQQFFLATSIKDSVINKFDLYKEWDIDPAGVHAKYYMDLEWATNVSVSRTQYESIVVKVQDYDPQRAKDICDEILKQYNALVLEFWRLKGREYFETANRAFEMRTRYVDSLQNRLEELSKTYGVLEYEMQSKELTQSYYAMLRGGASESKMNEIAEQLDNLKQYGPEFLKITTILKEYMFFYAQWKDKRDNYYFETVSDLSFYRLVEEPQVPVKKSYPVRWVIVVTSVLGSLLLAMILLAQFSGRKE